MEDIKGLYDAEYAQKVINSESAFPGGLLGPHLTDRGYTVTVYNPLAESVAVIDKRNNQKFEAQKLDDAGLFIAYLGCDTSTPYLIEITPYEGEP